jgi:glutathione S-transferase
LIASAPNPIKLRLYCAEKGLAIPFEHIDLTQGEQWKPALLKKNPQGTLPILALDNGTYLIESLVIMEYLEELYPKPYMIRSPVGTRLYTTSRTLY